MFVLSIAAIFVISLLLWGLRTAKYEQEFDEFRREAHYATTDRWLD